VTWSDWSIGTIAFLALVAIVGVLVVEIDLGTRRGRGNTTQERENEQG
jgi:hypothetical protein